ncbi:hypothetical protein [Vibrio cholerae]|uniref:hypothetical protein n=2 Tax=Vibrio cholerae TaxID=666 RepID=UPI000A1F5436|nr:hypothetical protein [Vibrio cholerae]EGR4165213.1 hypothetical protein [Vibrio cholerae]EGR4171920.1 hypothetical protein [Vibrio cholerae]EJK2098706.1 hypothetical protein [Vibrio cholerae]EJL6411705.1 hypothetical protein [Vibrio cholerae]
MLVTIATKSEAVTYGAFILRPRLVNGDVIKYKFHDMVKAMRSFIHSVITPALNKKSRKSGS